MNMEWPKGPLKSWRLSLPILWMVIIFLFSGDSLSSLQTSRFIIPLLQFVRPDLSPQKLTEIHTFLRKSGHFLEYFLLSYLWYWSLLARWPKGVKPFLLAFSFSLGYALLDEAHQSLLPSRTGSWWDVLIDGAGALLIQVILWLRMRREETRKGASLINERAWKEI